MKDRAAALRYARALERALDGDPEIARAVEELEAVTQVMASDPAVSVALVSPAFEPARKKALLDTLASKAGLSPRTKAFLNLLTDHGRLGLLPLVTDQMQRIRDRRLGILEAEVTTAAPMNSNLAERAKDALERSTGRKVRLALKTDPSLIGGMVARVGSTIFDASIRMRLEALRSRIARG